MYVGDSWLARTGYDAACAGHVKFAPATRYVFVSVARASHAVAMVRISAIVRFCFERCIAVSRFGMAIAARMPMIATTISSSIRVKPFWFLLMQGPPMVLSLSQATYDGRRLHNYLM